MYINMASQHRLSDAFPPGDCNNEQYQANVHKYLQKLEDLDSQLISYRSIISQEELEEIKTLHSEWFPIQYSNSYFEMAINKVCFAIVADIQIETEQGFQKFIVGYLKSGKVQQDLTQWLCSQPFKGIYIMTIGVINELRNKGIAKRLLNEMFKTHQNNPQLKYCYLHVIDYNKIAINFYEKNGFEFIKTKIDHYSINMQSYNAHIYAIYLNGSKRPQSFFQKIQNIINFLNFPQHIKNYLNSQYQVI